MEKVADPPAETAKSFEGLWESLEPCTICFAYVLISSGKLVRQLSKKRSPKELKNRLNQVSSDNPIYHYYLIQTGKNMSLKGLKGRRINSLSTASAGKHPAESLDTK